jgi:integrase
VSTRALVAAAPGPPDPIARLAAALEPATLARAGWDAERMILAPSPRHPTLGYRICAATGCRNTIARAGHDVICHVCADRLRRWRRHGRADDLAGFLAGARKQMRGQPPAVVHRSTGQESLCLVCRTPGHERPAASRGLCGQCSSQRHRRRQSLEAFLHGDERFPPGRPKPGFGACRVSGCERLAVGGNRLCDGHVHAWRRAGHPVGPALERWVARAGERATYAEPLPDRPPAPAARAAATCVDLALLPARLRLELLLGLQAAIRGGRRTPPSDLASALAVLSARGVTSVLALRRLEDVGTPGARAFLRCARQEVERALADPEGEAAKDVWDVGVFGKPGHQRIDFRAMSQGWLRRAAKGWALEKLPRVHQRSVRRVIQALGELSRSLRRRPDRGEEIEVLGRADALAFLIRLARDEQAGRLTRLTRAMSAKGVRQFLREAHAAGLSRPGGALHGLSGHFTLSEADLRPLRGPARREKRRDLPEVVLAQLLDPAALGALEAGWGATCRAAVEILAATGRRPSELLSVFLSCLDHDAPGEPVLVHDMPKADVEGYRLPIDGATAELVRAQQARVRARFPQTPARELALFPREAMNPEGRHPMSASILARMLRRWVDGLSALLGPDGEPYPRGRVVLYALRHSYAQRHADAGTPIEVLSDLLGHRDLKTTQLYFTVAEARKRRAIDALAPHQLDRRGEPAMPLVERLLESERARRRIGQVAVPFGMCTEPANVKAAGRACPFRHRCFGCEHFRTDPSYLPELRGYLTKLLADAERLASAAPALSDWARRDALPPPEEVEAVRALIRRCEALLGRLGEPERAEVAHAIEVARGARAQLGVSVPHELRGLARPPAPSLYPRAAAEAR